MRLFSASLLLMLLAFSAEAQNAPHNSLRQGTWELGIFGGGGTGLFAASDTHFLMGGARIGRVITREHLPGWFRGNFEYAADFMPFVAVFQPKRNAYGGAFTPVILEWNFKGNSKVSPYLLLSGGGIATASNVPAGNTSNFNFVAGGSAGVRIFTRPGRALSLETRWVHISNANLGTLNPQLVSNFMLAVGYAWFKSPRRE